MLYLDQRFRGFKLEALPEYENEIFSCSENHDVKAKSFGLFEKGTMNVWLFKQSKEVNDIKLWLFKQSKEVNNKAE